MRKSNGGIAPLAVSQGLVTQELDRETLIYIFENHKAMSLNSTLACVWALCNGKNTIFEIRELAERKLGAAVSKDVITLALDELRRNNLLVQDASAVDTNNLIPSFSRRMMVKKIGLTAAVAIPVITAITAPKAAQAASALIADGQPCTTDEECLNGCCFNSVVCQPQAACFGP